LEVDGTGSGFCPGAGFGAGGVELSCSANTVVVGSLGSYFFQLPSLPKYKDRVAKFVKNDAERKWKEESVAYFTYYSRTHL
jgi:hypothetical protein